MKAFFQKNRSVPIWASVSIIVALISAVVYAIAINSRAVADYINGTLSVFIRRIGSYITYIFPFSVFELILICLVPIIIALTVVFVKRADNRKSRIRTIFSLVALVSLLLTSYVYTLGIGYHTTPVSRRMGIEDSPDITKEQIYSTAWIVQSQVNIISDRLGADGVTVMPYGIDELSDKIVAAYDVFLEEYPILTNFTSRAKPVHFSGVMSDLRITGIYSFFTGEANVNCGVYPDFVLPFAVAHEFAHQRGVCRENEANFVAFLVCISSDDDFIKYSGYLNLYQYLSSAAYRADKEAYSELAHGLSDVARTDLKRYNEVYEEHEDSLLGEINDKVNDYYLKMNGTQGTVTYGYVVRLAVSYYENKK